jgi:hypothetical protein
MHSLNKHTNKEKQCLINRFHVVDQVVGAMRSHDHYIPQPLLAAHQWYTILKRNVARRF